MRQKFIDVEQVDRHIRIRCGQIIMHSEEYYDEASARRAARQLVKAINTRPMRLSLWLHGKQVVTLVRRVWATGAGKTVVLPVDDGPDTFRGSYFDPAFEQAGM